MTAGLEDMLERYTAVRPQDSGDSKQVQDAQGEFLHMTARLEDVLYTVARPQDSGDSR